MNSKFHNGLRLRPETTKRVEENTEIELFNIDLGNDFFGYKAKSPDIKIKD
jgi:hypothetical protein